MIDAVELDSLQDRIRTVGATGVRLDVIQKLPPEGKTPRLWLLDFTRLRDTHGPGKAKRSTLVEDLDIAADEFFGEESAALYVPDHGYLLVQYNHFGVRPKAMEAFFSDYLEGEVNVYEFNVVLDTDAEQRFKNQKYLKRFEIGVDITQLTAEDRSSGNALGAMADAAADLNATRMKVVISVGHDRERNLTGAKKLLQRFMHGNGAVISAEVAGNALNLSLSTPACTRGGDGVWVEVVWGRGGSVARGSVLGRWRRARRGAHSDSGPVAADSRRGGA